MSNPTPVRSEVMSDNREILLTVVLDRTIRLRSLYSGNTPTDFFRAT